MAQLAFAIAGAALGAALGPPGWTVLGMSAAGWGWMAGAMIGQLWVMSHQPTVNTQGPRLSDMKLSAGGYGAGIVKTYASPRVNGNIIWSSDLIETANTQTAGNKKTGKQSYTSYTYSVDCAVGVCEGPILGIRRIWANGKLIFDGSGDGPPANNAIIPTSGMSFYLGDETQTANPVMQSRLGADNVPAYRGLAYVVFENLQLEKFGNRHPKFDFEIGGSNVFTWERIPAQPDLTWLASYNPLTDQFWAGDFDGQSKIFKYNGSTGLADGTVNLGLIMDPTSSGFMHQGFDSEDNCYWYSAIYDPEYVPRKTTLCKISATTGEILASRLITSSPLSTHVRFHPFANRLIAFETQWAYPYNNSGNIVSKKFYAVNKTTLEYSHEIVFTGIDGFEPNFFRMVDFEETASDVNGYRYITHQEVFSNWPSKLLRFDPSDCSISAIYTFESQYTRMLGFDPVRKNVYLAYDATETILLKPGEVNGWHDWLAVFNIDTFTTVGWVAFDGWDIIGVPDAMYDNQRSVLWYIEYTQWGDDWETFLPKLRGVSCETFETIYYIDLGGMDYSYSDDDPDDDPYPWGLECNATYPEIWIHEATGFDPTVNNFLRIVPTNGGYIQVPLGTIIQDVGMEAGLEATDLDVTDVNDIIVDGYIRTTTTAARSVIEPLLSIYNVDAFESDGKIKFIKKTSGTLGPVVPEDDLGASLQVDSNTDTVNIIRVQEIELPNEVSVRHIDRSLDYDINQQYARRLSGESLGSVSIDAPAVITATQAINLANSVLYRSWVQRDQYSFSTTQKYAAYEPTDLLGIPFDGINQTVRIVKKEEDGFLINWSGVSEDLTVYDQNQIGSSGNIENTPIIPTYCETDLLVFETPVLRDEYDYLGYVVVAGGLTSAPWAGGNLYIIAENSVATMVSLGPLPSRAITGTLTTNLSPVSDPITASFDVINTFNVSIPWGELESHTEAEVLAGMNTAVISHSDGSVEVLGFQTATLISPGNYTISNLLRRIRQNSSFSQNGNLGQRFALLTSDVIKPIPMQLTNLNNEYTFAGPAIGTSLDEAETIDVTLTGMSKKPLSPILLTGSRLLNNDVQIQWTRRTRIGGSWPTGENGPLGELYEAYEIDVMAANHTTVLRTLTSTTPTVIYTNANQIADFGSQPNSVEVNIYQMSDWVGRGYPANFTFKLLDAGASIQANTCTTGAVS